MKRKNNHTPRFPVYEIVTVLFVMLIVGVFGFCLCVLSVLLPFLTYNTRHPTPNATVIAEEETLILPLNSEEPVYTENKYSDWVAISISGSIERNGEFLFDALHHRDALAQGLRGGFRGFLIDGKWVQLGRGPTPKYRDDHIYRYSYSVYRNIRDTNLHLPKTLGFQIISEAARGLEGEFTVEVSSDSFKYWPDRRGR
ncbi:MAG: hypothetical protein J4G18_08895 [Anaerolineae bacterium]|nr:hypothetical protein [Anaerolineae bacterium]